MKIGIFCGDIPPPVFVDNLIRQLSNNHSVVLFGKMRTKKNPYSNSAVTIKNIGRTRLSRFIKAVGLIFKSLIMGIPIFQIINKLKCRCVNIGTILNQLSILLPMLTRRLDILHIQWAKSVVLYPELIHFKQYQIVVSLRGTHINISPLVNPTLAADYKKIFPLIDGFHAVSESLAKAGEKYGAAREKIHRIYPAVQDRIIYHYSKVVKSKSNTTRIISVGRHHWVKGYTFALDAMQKLQEMDIPFNYTIIASGVDREHLHFQIKDLGLTEKVSLINGMPHEKVLEEIKAADILLQPSFSEGIANTVLEAMAVGTLVISADTGGMGEVITSGKNGFLFKVRDVSSLVDCITKVVKLNPEQIQNIIQTGHESITSQHKLSNQGKAMEEFYSKIIHGLKK